MAATVAGVALRVTRSLGVPLLLHCCGDAPMHATFREQCAQHGVSFPDDLRRPSANFSAQRGAAFDGGAAADADASARRGSSVTAAAADAPCAQYGATIGDRRVWLLRDELPPALPLASLLTGCRAALHHGGIGTAECTRTFHKPSTNLPLTSH